MPNPPLHDEARSLASRASALGRATATAHRSVLVLIAACALATLWFGGEATGPQPRTYTYAAVALGVATIAARSFSTSAAVGLRARLFWALGSLGCAGAIALVSAAIGIQHGDQQAGLVIALAAGIFVIRPPEAIALTQSAGG